MTTRAGLLILPFALAACGVPAEKEERSAPAANGASTPAPASSATPSPAPSPSTAAAPTGILSCRADIGAAAAGRLVEACRNVSPATHPPCNAQNSCAIIQDEIARSCALFDGDGPPMKGCTTDPKGMEAAADVVRRYYSAINARDYATAWQQWGDDGQPGRTYAAFEKGFAGTRAVSVAIGRLQPGDGAAGSVYQPVPVTVDSTLADGSRQRFTGTYVIRRVNDVDGATPAQLRWHIDSAKLQRAAAP